MTGLKFESCTRLKSNELPNKSVGHVGDEDMSPMATCPFSIERFSHFHSISIRGELT